MFSLKDKVAIVTGGACGIGAAVVKEFLQEGVKHVAILDVDEESGRSIEKQMAANFGNDKVKFIKCDVTIEEELLAAYEKTSSNYGYIDIVVNNAGIADERPDMFKRTIDINFTALSASTLKALEMMREDKGGHGGTIINISSIAALLLVAPTIFIYAATKAAVLHLTCSLGKESYFANTKVRTIAICFGCTISDIYKRLGSFDENIEKVKEIFIKIMPPQTAEVAAIGLVEAYKNGQSGSTWLVKNSKPAIDITSKINKAYEILSENIFE
ncbi:15-hydroxyprostaglandin dehydrogenase [NAD(+)]-like [Vanessa cardui]|uniref:15-hydroxyprostaglandin dehydrogenase [NAD(+)]-like n=1 Tax=Vanessa cardui TaxID=171605 RepID=UPI001F12F6C8|nr:15-hydroxyprostaglandin dehydrogenase [NAD(+)]-like [Vanessa cardui]